MLRTASGLKGSGIQARDGAIGSVHDLLFDDRRFVTRWVVVDTGTWLTGRQVLLPPSAFGRPAGEPRAFPVDLTREQVRNSPDVATDAPVFRQREADLYGHYGWDPYWAGPMAYSPAGAGLVAFPPGYAPPHHPAPPPGAGGAAAGDRPGERQGDPHLRSANEVTGYYVEASDGGIGHVEDLLVEDDGWAVRYLIVDTRNWWPGRKVLVAPEWVREFRWADREVVIALTREQIERSPEYDPAAALDRTYEERLHHHYERAPYWA